VRGRAPVDVEGIVDVDGDAVTDLDVVTDATVGEVFRPGSANAGRRVALRASVC